MHILFLAIARIPTEKAHGLQIAKTVEALGRRADVTLMCPNRKNAIRDTVFHYYSLENTFTYTTLRNPFIFLERRLEGVYFPLLRFYMWIRMIIVGMSPRYDTILTREIVIAYVLSLLRKGVIFEDHEPKVSSRWLYRHMVRVIQKKIIIPKQLGTLYEEYDIPRESYRFIPNGVDLKEFDRISRDEKWIREQTGIGDEEPIILYVGHFYRWKGVYILIDAASSIEGKVVLLGGTPDEYIKVKKYISDKKIENIVVHPFVPHHEAIQFIKSADVLILPNTAKEERSYLYTTPIKLFEYMASGVPIVASDIESFSSYLEDHVNAIFCRPDDPASLAEAVRKVHGLGGTIAAKAKSSVLDYDWSNRAKKIIDFISA